MTEIARTHKIQLMQPAKVFVSYASTDERYRQQLETHLAPLKRDGIIKTWSFRQIEAGDDWRETIDTQLDAADIILLLISASFIASDYCWSVELKRALERHRAGDVVLIPIIVRPCDWQETAFAKLQALPTDARPVSKWTPRDGAWLSVASAIRRVVTTQKESDQPSAEVVLPSAPAIDSSEPAIVYHTDPSLLPQFHLDGAWYSSYNNQLNFTIKNYGAFINIEDIEVISAGCEITTWWPNTLPPGETLHVPTKLSIPGIPSCMYRVKFKDPAGYLRTYLLTLDRSATPSRLDFQQIAITAA